MAFNVFPFYYHPKKRKKNMHKHTHASTQILILAMLAIFSGDQQMPTSPPQKKRKKEKKNPIPPKFVDAPIFAMGKAPTHPHPKRGKKEKGIGNPMQTEVFTKISKNFWHNRQVCSFIKYR